MASTLHLTGFGKFYEHYDNPSELLINGIFGDVLAEKLSDATEGVIDSVRTYVLNVTGNESNEGDFEIFQNGIRKVIRELNQGDIVLSFGQGGLEYRDLTVESRFGNVFARSDYKDAAIIISDEPKDVGPGSAAMARLMKTVVEANPEIDSRYVVSDNAGRYSCNAAGYVLNCVPGVTSVFTHLPMLANSTGLEVFKTRNPQHSMAQRPELLRVMDYDFTANYIVAMATFLAKGVVVSGKD